MTQYVHQQWTIETGLPQNSVRAIAQTPDGYLWLATEEGLARFDGLRFTYFNRQNTPAFIDDSFLSLYVDHQGTVWAGAIKGGLYRYQQHQWSMFRVIPHLQTEQIRTIFEDASHTLWIGTDQGLYQWTGRLWQFWDESQGLPANTILSLTQTKDGILWIGTTGGLSQVPSLLPGKRLFVSPVSRFQGWIRALYTDNSGQLWFIYHHGLWQWSKKDGFRVLKKDLPLASAVLVVYRDSDGIIWIGTRKALVRVLLQSDGKIKVDSIKLGPVRALFEDREGNLWIGTIGKGLHVLKNGKMITFTQAEGLPHDNILSVFEDHKGRIWVGTYGGGVAQWNGHQWKVFGNREGLTDTVALSLTEDVQGHLWVGTVAGIYIYQHHHFEPLKNLTVGRYVLALYRDRKGQIWAGTAKGLFRWQSGRFFPIKPPGKKWDGVIRVLHQDQQGHLWIGTEQSVYIYAHGALTKLHEPRVFRRGIEHLFEDDDGTLWFSTWGGGIVRYKGKKYRVYNRKDGLPVDKIFCTLVDHQGNIWMSSNFGIFMIPQNVMNAYDRGRITQLKVRHFGVADGMKTRECNGGVNSPCWRDQKGQLWFGTIKGVVRVQPSRMPINPHPPTVYLEKIFVDEKPVSWDRKSPLLFNPGHRRWVFHFSAPTFIAPEKVTVYYRLKGFDKKWLKSTREHIGTYTQLPPGQYQLEFKSQNEDGFWSKPIPALTITIQPSFFQTRWFYFLVVLGFLLLSLSIHKIRIWQLQKNKQKLEELVKKRTQELQHLTQELQRLSYIDPLTGIYNRRYFNDILQREWRRSITDQQPLALVMVDVDYFKRFNDRYGHVAGDECLRKIAHVLQQAVKHAWDVVARYGGDEFAILLLHTGLKGGRSVAERLQTKVVNLRIPHRDSPITPWVTISVGVAVMVASTDTTPAELIKKADKALYQAKHKGRNRIWILNDNHLQLNS